MNRTEMKQYKDPKDRKLISKFFKDRGIELTEGGEFDVDLEGTDYDVEISHLSFESLWNQWKKENIFRVEIRKRDHYWSDVKDLMKDSYGRTTHFIQLNGNRTEMLIYSHELLREYAWGTEKLLPYLMKYKGFTEKESTFMCIPFESGKYKIKRFKLISNVWEKVNE